MARGARTAWWNHHGALPVGYFFAMGFLCFLPDLDGAAPRAFITALPIGLPWPEQASLPRRQQEAVEAFPMSPEMPILRPAM